MVSILKRLLTLRIRKERRFKAKKGVYVVYDHSFAKNQVDNISMGGLSFYYIDPGIKIDKGVYELSLLTQNRRQVDSISFKTVSDNEAGEILGQRKRIKRQSVRFEHLTHDQKHQLKDIIKHHTTR